MSRNSVNRYFEGLLVGGALGFLAGLLLATKPGTELRKDLSESYDDLMSQINDQFGDLKSNLSDKAKPLADRASVYKERAQQYSRKVRAHAADLKDRVSDRTAGLRDRVASSRRSGGRQLVDNFMGNYSGPMYTPGAKAPPDQAASSVADSSGTYSANKSEAAGG